MTNQLYPLGTANTPVGRTIVVSIFCDDDTYSWDFDSKIDQNTVNKVNRYMQIAGDYIEDVAESYGKEAEFITDFHENPDLFYSVSLNCDMSDAESRAYRVWKYIDKNIDTYALQDKYDADNVIYFVITNTDWNNRNITSTRDWYEGMPYPYEIVYLFTIDDTEANCPAVYAHEILHTFGAPDLYTTDDTYGIDKTAVKYFENNMPNELMYCCSDLRSTRYLYDRINNEVSELTAYYIGLTDSSELVTELGLEPSQHTYK
ncbi:hypothetical protein [Butyrivibrio sp. XPD2002]|uniref:hypothetical protein n=1 Tax=Butyrivibrio sp. XPD2002 TaxID=1280665 RepID=UPI00047BB05F|nr:hypothetical protein [Butyrivibrio sp. XPD2002]